MGHVLQMINELSFEKFKWLYMENRATFNANKVRIDFRSSKPFEVSLSFFYMIISTNFIKLFRNLIF